jgi:Cu/Ag efflux pump CusA
MLNWILDTSLKNRMLVLLAAVALLLGGSAVVRTMDVDVFPDLTAPTVAVLTEAHGMEAMDVEQLITFQVETGLNGSPHVRRIRSSSAAGISIVWVELTSIVHDKSWARSCRPSKRNCPSGSATRRWRPFRPSWAR